MTHFFALRCGTAQCIDVCFFLLLSLFFFFYYYFTSTLHFHSISMVVSQRDATCARATRMVSGERGRQAGREDSSDRQRPSCMLLEHVQCSIQRQTQTTTKSCVGGAAITCYTADCFGSGARVERPSQFRLAERNWNDWYRISVCVECGRCCPPLIVAAG